MFLYNRIKTRNPRLFKMRFVDIFLLVFKLVLGSTETKSPSSLVRDIVNSQSHVHIVNPNERKTFQIIGGVKYPITINSRCAGKFGFQLERVKGINCVILLNVKFSKDESSCNGLGAIVENFGENFIFVREAYFLHYKGDVLSLMSRSCSLILVTSRRITAIEYDLQTIFFLDGFRFSKVAVFHYQQNHFQIYTLCRFCGNKVPGLVNMGFSFRTVPEISNLVSDYNEKIVFFLSPRNEVVDFFV